MSERAAARDQVASFLAKYSRDVARVGRAVRSKIRKRLPGAVELVYDNYNALVFAFGPTERPSELILSVALYPRWVSLFFAQGATLPDPEGLLQGSGSRIRHVVLEREGDLDSAPICALVEAAVMSHPEVNAGRGRTIVKSVSARQRPRRPTGRGHRTRR